MAKRHLLVGKQDEERWAGRTYCGLGLTQFGVDRPLQIVTTMRFLDPDMCQNCLKERALEVFMQIEQRSIDWHGRPIAPWEMPHAEE